MEVLSKRERDDFLNKKKELEGSLNTTTQFDAQRNVDRVNIKKKIVDIDKSLEGGAAPTVGGGEKDGLYSRAQYLEGIIKNGMPSDSEMKGRMLRGGGREPYPGMVGRHMKWQEANKKNISEYKQLMRTIDPDNPNAGNVELLRKR